jgi:phosphohistidine phosphatase SixA
MPESEHHPNLYVIRHGDCVTGSGLTDRGRQQMEAARNLLNADNGPVLTRILSSPQARAIESARILRRGLYVFEESSDVMSCLDSEMYVSGKVDIPARLAERHQAEDQGIHSFVLVMHEPDIVALMRTLGPRRTPGGRITLGSCWKLSFSPEEPHRQLEPAPIAA